MQFYFYQANSIIIEQCLNILPENDVTATAHIFDQIKLKSPSPEFSKCWMMTKHCAILFLSSKNSIMIERCLEILPESDVTVCVIGVCIQQFSPLHFASSKIKLK